MNILCVIPARYSSTRLPGKPLALIAGKPMIQRVYEQAKKAKRPTAVLIATDHELVYQTVQDFGGQVMMTSPDHPTGTDRLAEVAQEHPEADIIINVQGDEPLIAPEVIDLLAGAFDKDPELNMATLMTEMDKSEYNLPSAVKVVASLTGYALYFSRSLIPYPRSNKLPGGLLPVYKHIGIYAYRREFLLNYAALIPTPLEQMESLEQLRALEHGYKIKVLKTDFKSIGVDTPEDLEKVNEYFRRCNL
ncbi:3-deoxy-manno-octulosonate cytidylyltransferase [Sporomusa ovata DSM 2662]|uniref:3-deoxy-manno-octulosonate cytidylyltransferase n=1 Tax=Sporomusa ovata TaxID=2378 RepID=A0A0U1KTZ5_9FIRM|nr:3-deoxy-manno-octulosonate cytidylyltransferase [Sporomusa ovata]EQB26493.1 3-deoxy-manno-octulosonate cytidylyltransferase [Sporomusa ovata DSM 2662]CQR70579.1 3-deoxy-manno-octulosonate cytidylyltransferase [Sporomusa ovata]